MNPQSIPADDAMHVAVATMDDVDAACGIIVECRKALDARGIPQWDERYPGRAFLQEAIACGNLFALRDRSAIVGIAVVDDWQPPEWMSASWTQRDAPFLAIHAFAISPRAQGRGHGTTLLACCEAVARRRGARGMRLDAFSENAVALRFYERHGYCFCGEVRFASKPIGHQCYHCYEKALV